MSQLTVTNTSLKSSFVLEFLGQQTGLAEKRMANNMKRKTFKPGPHICEVEKYELPGCYGVLAGNLT